MHARHLVEKQRFYPKQQYQSQLVRNLTLKNLKELEVSLHKLLLVSLINNEFYCRILPSEDPDQHIGGGPENELKVEIFIFQNGKFVSQGQKPVKNDPMIDDILSKTSATDLLQIFIGKNATGPIFNSIKELAEVINTINTNKTLRKVLDLPGQIEQTEKTDDKTIKHIYTQLLTSSLDEGKNFFIEEINKFITYINENNTLAPFPSAQTILNSTIQNVKIQNKKIDEILINGTTKFLLTQVIHSKLENCQPFFIKPDSADNVR
jgi:hypothetical protein